MEDDKFKSISHKLTLVNHLVNEVTIGPNAVQNRKSVSPIKSEQKDSTENRRNYNADANMLSQIPTMKFLKVLEPLRQEEVQNALNNRISMFKRFERCQKEQTMELWRKTKRNLIENAEKNELSIIQASEQFDIQQSTQQALLLQQTKNALMRMKEKQKQLREQEKQRLDMIQQQIDKVKKNQHKFYIEWTDIIEILKSTENLNNFLIRNAGKFDFAHIQTMPSNMGAINEKCKIKSDSSFSLTEEDIQKSEDILTKIIEFKTTIKRLIEEETQNSVKPEEPLKGTSSQLSVTEMVKPSINEQTNKLAKYINLNDLRLYLGLMENLVEYKKSCDQLENDSSSKNFRFDLKKAVNIPVNSLSALNSEHVMDKYQRLFRLLKGETVFVSEKQVNASRHPQGIAFCMDLLAKKFVLQGDLMVSANPESAFCYASVILSLWNDFPEFGELVLAYFYKSCPYLVPYYIPKQVGDSDEEYYQKLGYQYSDGEIERQDKFLKRMTGIMKLYFALLISKPKRSQCSSPYSLQYGWKWLASFLRLPPQIDITATALHTFLETVGFKMEKHYGKMFQKILMVIIEDFLPKCQKIHSTGGAVKRLEMLLTQYLKTKKFMKPAGYEMFLTDVLW